MVLPKLTGLFSTKKQSNITMAATPDTNPATPAEPKESTSEVITTQATEDLGDIFAGNASAKAASDHEQNMSMWYTVKHYRAALFWAALMAAPIIMEGYETALVPSFMSLQTFKSLYGRAVDAGGDDHKVIPAIWQSSITIAAAIGQIGGLLVAPRLVNRFGYRLCTMGGLIWAGCCLMIGFWSTEVGPKLHMYLAGEFLLGMPWGLFQGITLPYASDITPLKLKGPATTMINIFWLIGQLAAAGVLRGAFEINGVWSIKLPMLIQYSWLAPLLFMVFLAPESPLYLSRNKQDDKALKVLRRVTNDPLFDEQGSLAMMHAVNTHEEKTCEKMGFTECFKGTNLRRTEIALVVYLTQQLIGSPLIFYSVNVLQKGGLTPSNALYMTIGMYGLCICSTLSSMAAMRMFGRRTMWLGGLAAEVTCLGTIGILGFYLHSSNAAAWATAVLLVMFAVIYNFTIGPVCYTIVSETPSTRLKATTNSLARGTYIAVSIGNLFLVPKLLEPTPDGWGLGTRAALVWAGTSSICLLWAFFRLPEMMDRTPAEVDVMFERKVPARDWKETRL